MSLCIYVGIYDWQKNLYFFSTMSGDPLLYQQNQPFQSHGHKKNKGCFHQEIIPYFRFLSNVYTTIRFKADVIRAFCAPELCVVVRD